MSRRSKSEAAVSCNECGWENPAGAKYCTQCGAHVQEVEASEHSKPASPGDRSANSEVANGTTGGKIFGARVGAVVFTGVLAVLALFVITSVSKKTPPAVASAPASVEPAAIPDLEPLTNEVAAEVAALEKEIGQLSGADKEERFGELIAVYVRAQQLGRAAETQRTFAEEVGSVDAWRLAGDLYYDWMRTLEVRAQPSAAVAQKAVDAYVQVLEREPDNLDVRTDMATAYLTSNNPMQAVAEIKNVLAQDSTHVQARFNYGVMLSRIGRMDQALEQWELVKQFADPSSAQYQQAENAIRAVQVPAD